MSKTKIAGIGKIHIIPHKGKDGTDGHTPTREELEAILESLKVRHGEDGKQGEKGEKGERGERGEKGESIKGDKGDAGKDGKDGKDADIAPIVEKLTKEVEKRTLEHAQVIDRKVSSKTYDIDEIVGGVAFETVSKNLKSYPYELNYTGDNLTSLVYDLGGGLSITKTLSYTGDNLTSIVLSGTLPSGITTTKTLLYTGDNLVEVLYS